MIICGFILYWGDAAQLFELAGILLPQSEIRVATAFFTYLETSDMIMLDNAWWLWRHLDKLLAHDRCRCPIVSHLSHSHSLHSHTWPTPSSLPGSLWISEWQVTDFSRNAFQLVNVCRLSCSGNILKSSQIGCKIANAAHRFLTLSLVDVWLQNLMEGTLHHPVSIMLWTEKRCDPLCLSLYALWTAG